MHQQLKFGTMDNEIWYQPFLSLAQIEWLVALGLLPRPSICAQENVAPSVLLYSHVLSARVDFLF